LTGTATGTPKTRTGNIEAIRVLTVARRSGANEWIAVLSQIRHVVFTAPDEIRAPSLLEVHGVGFDVAAKLLIAAGDNPHRIRSEAAWAHLCGVAPIPASSGKIQRHRLNRPATSTGRSWLRRTGSHLRGCASSDLPPDPAGGHLW
jgi:transposase